MTSDAEQQAKRPRVSVIAICFNHARFVEQCLNSIAAQTFQDFELIISDDASSDNSAEIVSAWLAQYRADARFIQNGANRGICRVLNTALAAAKGEFIAMISTDDAWYPEKLEHQVAALAGQPKEVAMVYSDAALMDEHGSAIPGRFIERNRPGLTPPSGDVFGVLSEANFIPAMATLVRTDSLRAVGGYDESLSYEDYDMWLRIARRFQVLYYDATVAKYRIVATSLGHALFQAKNNNRAIITNCIIAAKLLSEPGLRAEYRAQWTRRLLDSATGLYAAGDAKAGSYLRQAAKLTRNPRHIILAGAATVGLTHSRLQKLTRMLR